LFQDPFAEGDVRCLYDQQTQSFYFTEIGFPVATGPVVQPGDPLPYNTTVDVAVLNKNGIAEYQFDTSLGNTCFGDQPKTGFNNNALVVSTDEYCGTNEIEEGALAVVISKPQLIAQAATVNDQQAGPVSLAGNPVVGMDPAIGTGTSTAYFVNSVPFLPDGSNNPVGDAPPFNEPRWGDYSFAQPDPNGIGVWLATEYIPSAADQNPLDNWGTYVLR
jgi:hypothetical protein